MNRHTSPIALLSALAVAEFAAVAPLRAGSSSVSIELTGTIEARCANNASAFSLAGNNVSVSGSKTIGFELDCNAPFEYSLQSLNGGFKRVGDELQGSGFASLVPYAVSVSIPLDGGRAINDSCQSFQIKTGSASCRLSNSGNAVAIKKPAAMSVAWEKSVKPLMEGTYQDQLTVSFSIRP